jgi:acyl-CoA thioesterase FadM
VQTYYAIEHLEIRQQCAEGFATLVWYDLAAKKAIALPPALRGEVS